MTYGLRMVSFSSVRVSSGLKPLNVEVVVQKAWVCPLSEWEHQYGGRRRRGSKCMCAC